MRTYIRIDESLKVIEVIEAMMAVGYLISPREGVTVGDILTQEEAEQIGYTLPPAPEPPPYAWFIDHGSFYDRFGESMMPVLMSTDTQVQALVKNLEARKWIELQRPEVATGLDLLIAKELITEEQKTAILTTPIDFEEQRALVKMYFS